MILYCYSFYFRTIGQKFNQILKNENKYCIKNNGGNPYELGRDGIRINAISAGPIKTLSAKGIKDFSSILDIVEEKSPLHKNVTTREVWDTVSFLFSNMSSAITGEVIHVDNGFSTVGV